MGTCGPAESEEGTLAIRDARVKARRPGHWVDGDRIEGNKPWRRGQVPL